MFNENDLRSEITRIRNSKSVLKNELNDDFLNEIYDLLSKEPKTVFEVIKSSPFIREQVISICKEKLELHRNTFPDMIGYTALIVSIMTLCISTLINLCIIKNVIYTFIFFVLLCLYSLFSLERKRRNYRIKYQRILSFFESFRDT